MRALGYTDELPLWRRFQLALHDVGPRYVRDLKSEGFDKLTLDQVQLVEALALQIADVPRPDVVERELEPPP